LASLIAASSFSGAPSGAYCGKVPIILDNKITFSSDGTSADIDINVKIAHKEVVCKAEAVSTSASMVTFPNIAKTGDCMGDALRGQKKDPSKYFLNINSDGSLSFHSDGYPALKMKPCNGMAEEEESATTQPCCQGACATAGQEKYYSIAKSLFGTKHCGECCMDPKDYPKYHLFERNLTKAATDSPCKGFGYTKYDSTTTHGFGPVKMTLDLYDLPSTSD